MSVKIALCGEAWGESEARIQHPFVGSSGIELLQMLHEAQIISLSSADYGCIEAYWRSGTEGANREPRYTKIIWDAHSEVTLLNVFNFRPPNNDIEALCGPKREDTTGLPPIKLGKYVKAEYLTHVEKLKADLERLRPNLVVALGNIATWALFKSTGITRIRGNIVEATLVPGQKVLPTFHPAAILRQYELRHVTVIDFIKAKREAEYPDIRRPRREVWTEPTLSDLATFWDRYIEGARWIAPDIETAGRQITCIGFSPAPEVAIVVPFVDTNASSGSYWKTIEDERKAWEWVRRVLDHPAPKVFQNGLYDIHFLWRGYGIKVRNVAEDTMLLHHAMQPESPKGLGFLGSVYTNEAPWKLMRDRKKTTLKRDDN